ncbi:MAG: helix-turn-helix transcriptional regulator [Clostridia bacterium]|nr:helix-turn-helix transcriptional regulator [Clostridia bacterium]
MNIGNTIYQLRTAAKLSQEQFAELFHVSRQSVQKWVAATPSPSLISWSALRSILMFRWTLLFSETTTAWWRRCSTAKP